MTTEALKKQLEAHSARLALEYARREAKHEQN